MKTVLVGIGDPGTHSIAIARIIAAMKGDAIALIDCEATGVISIQENSILFHKPKPLDFLTNPLPSSLEKPRHKISVLGSVE